MFERRVRRRRRLPVQAARVDERLVPLGRRPSRRRCLRRRPVQLSSELVIRLLRLLGRRLGRRLCRGRGLLGRLAHRLGRLLLGLCDRLGRGLGRRFRPGGCLGQLLLELVVCLRRLRRLFGGRRLESLKLLTKLRGPLFEKFHPLLPLVLELRARPLALAHQHCVVLPGHLGQVFLVLIAPLLRLRVEALVLLHQPRHLRHLPALRAQDAPRERAFAVQRVVRIGEDGLELDQEVDDPLALGNGPRQPL